LIVGLPVARLPGEVSSTDSLVVSVIVGPAKELPTMPFTHGSFGTTLSICAAILRLSLAT
jgi:hypothetical protein